MFPVWGSGITGSFLPTSVSPSAPTSTLTVNTASTSDGATGARAETGPDEFTITGTGGGLTRTASAMLEVMATSVAAISSGTFYVTGENATGTTPYGSYSGQNENINLVNRNLNIVLPLFTLGGRNGMDVTVVVQYNSTYQDWIIETSPLDDSQQICHLESLKGLTRPHFYIMLAPDLRRVQGIPHRVNPNLISKGYVLTMPDGTRTEFRHKDHDEDLLNSSVFAGNQTFRSFDGSQMQLKEQTDGAIVYFKNGTSIKFASQSEGATLLPEWMRDTNGNTVNYNRGSSGTTNTPDTLVDTLGRTVERHIDGATTTIKVKDQDGQYLVYTLARPNDNLQTLTLPNGLQYTMVFDDKELSEPCDFYDSLVEQERPKFYAKVLTKITYPTGGYTRYEWEPYRVENSRKEETGSSYRLSKKYLESCRCRSAAHHLYLRTHPRHPSRRELFRAYLRLAQRLRTREGVVGHPTPGNAGWDLLGRRRHAATHRKDLENGSWQSPGHRGGHHARGVV